MLKRLYPYGKAKACNLTYDDGVLQDVRLVELLNRYGLKATFNLNSELMAQEFAWTHESGLQIRRLSPDRARHLYDGHEIASHTLTHPYLAELSREHILYEMGKDRETLSNFFEREISGFALPFDGYNDTIRSCAIECGFDYARISEESFSYEPERDYFAWRAGIFHLSPQLYDYVEGFFTTNEELALCQIVGHSYDLDTEGLWERMEELFATLHSHEDILPMTHIELVRYLRAIRSAVVAEEWIENPSDIELWFEWNGKKISVLPHARYSRL